MQLDGSAKRSRFDPQSIPLRPSPSSPFDDYDDTETKKLTADFPLQRFDLAALLFIVDVDRKRLHPFIGTEPNRAQPAF